MKTRNLTIRIKNDTDRKQAITLFHAAFTFTMVNFGMPAGVSVRVESEIIGMRYLDLLALIMADRMPVRIISSTNNRKLTFRAHSLYRREPDPMEPHLTKKGNYRPRKGRKYLMKWNPKKWNIADTHEPFLLDIGVECELVIKPWQEFNLELHVFERTSGPLTLKIIPNG